MAINITKTRFAPSPSGFLHLGNARTALFSALLARKERGIFLLRIEDTDQERSQSQYIQGIEDDMNWLGLTWQEGPGVDGAHAPYLQSQRGAIYRNYFDALEQQGLAYLCFCSERELDLTRKTQIASGQPPRYPGTCAHLNATEVAARLQRDVQGCTSVAGGTMPGATDVQGRAQAKGSTSVAGERSEGARMRGATGVQPTLRFRVPAQHTVEFDDVVRGPQKFNSDDIGDFVIRRGDGTPAFFFSNAIDDALMGVTHVLRGEDHLTNTPRQIMLLDALRLQVPRYGHISMIVGADGAPLSKRHGSRSIRELRQTGYLPGAITNYMARLGHYYPNNAFMDLDALASEFEIGNLGRAPAHYDTTHLLHWQREALMRADADTLWQWMGADVHTLVASAQQAAFVAAVRTNVMFPEHALLWARTLYVDPLSLSPEACKAVEEAGGAFFEHALTALDQHGADYKALVNHIKQETGAKGKALFHPLRAALTGELDGPEMAQLVMLLPLERMRLRLHAAMQAGAPMIKNP